MELGCGSRYVWLHIEQDPSLALKRVNPLPLDQPSSQLSLHPHCGADHCSPQVVSPEERFWNATGAAFVTVQESEQVAGAVVAEIILTTLLALTVCMGAINQKTLGPLAPLCIGFSVTVDILAG